METNKLSIKAKDGTDVTAFARNISEKSTRGIVIISHGFGEHSESYHELIECLAHANYASVIFDQRGHGKLSERGIIPSYQCFLDDIDAVSVAMRQLAPGIPLALYGHSMGGNIVANYLLKNNQSDFCCAVLESPWLGLYKEVNPLIAAMAKVLGFISPRIAIVSKLSTNDITGDKVRAEEYGNDPNYHNRISLRMFTGIKNGCTYAVDNASQLAVPIYLAYAKYEKIVSNQAILKFGSTCPYVTMKEYESCHAIHNDVNKDALYRDIIAFLNGHCPKKG